MDALVPAFVAALLVGVGDRATWLAAILGDRYRGAVAVLAGIALAHIAIAALAVAASAVIGPRITPNAQALMLALALLAAGVGACWRPRHIDRFEGSRIGATLTAAIGTASLALGGSIAFLTFALAARSAAPALAGVGAVAGTLAIAAAAAMLGEEGWRRLPLGALSAGAGALLLLAGLATGASALRLT